MDQEQEHKDKNTRRQKER